MALELKTGESQAALQQHLTAHFDELVRLGGHGCHLPAHFDPRAHPASHVNDMTPRATTTAVLATVDKPSAQP